MKNKIIILILIIFCFQNIAFSQSFNFEGNNIEILDKGNQINVKKGKAFSKDNNFEISSDKFEYYKDDEILKSEGNGLARVKSKKLNIKYDNAIFDQKNLILEANGNIEVFQTNKDFIIKNNKIFYDQKNNIISSDDTTKIEDRFGNIYIVDSFKFEVNQDLIKVENLVSKDKQNNTFKTSLAFINTRSGKIFWERC